MLTTQNRQKTLDDHKKARLSKRSDSSIEFDLGILEGILEKVEMLVTRVRSGSKKVVALLFRHMKKSWGHPWDGWGQGVGARRVMMLDKILETSWNFKLLQSIHNAC